MKAQFEVFALETLMELPRLSRLGLQYKILLYKRLNLFFGGDFGDIIPDVDERSIELEFVIEEFGKNELNLRVELLDFQTVQILLLELPDDIGIVGYHSFQKPA